MPRADQHVADRLQVCANRSRVPTEDADSACTVKQVMVSSAGVSPAGRRNLLDLASCEASRQKCLALTSLQITKNLTENSSMGH